MGSLELNLDVVGLQLIKSCKSRNITDILEVVLSEKRCQKLDLALSRTNPEKMRNEKIFECKIFKIFKFSYQVHLETVVLNHCLLY